jgi:hypothetical protein
MSPRMQVLLRLVGLPRPSIEQESAGSVGTLPVKAAPPDVAVFRARRPTVQYGVSLPLLNRGMLEWANP